MTRLDCHLGHPSPVYVVIDGAHCDSCDMELDGHEAEEFPLELCAFCLRSPGSAYHPLCGGESVRYSQAVPA